MGYRKDWLSGAELVEWAKHNYPEIKIRRRLETNSHAEARSSIDGKCFAKFTSNRDLLEHMKTKEFRIKVDKYTSRGFGFKTAVFKGDGY